MKKTCLNWSNHIKNVYNYTQLDKGGHAQVEGISNLGEEVDQKKTWVKAVTKNLLLINSGGYSSNHIEWSNRIHVAMADKAMVMMIPLFPPTMSHSCYIHFVFGYFTAVCCSDNCVILYFDFIYVSAGSCNSRSYFGLCNLCHRRWAWSASTKDGIHRGCFTHTRMWQDRFSGSHIFYITE